MKILITIAQWGCFGLGIALAGIILLITCIATVIAELTELFNLKKTNI